MTSDLLAPARPAGGDPHGVLAAATLLGRARWAARAFAGYDLATVRTIALAVATAGEQHARAHAEWVVRETGVGVVDDKERRHLGCSRDLHHRYQGDWVSMRTVPADGSSLLPRPAGVVVALTPWTDPVSSVYATVLSAVLTRNAVVIVPHPRARECCAGASRVLGEAAAAAGAPDGVVQCVQDPNPALAESLVRDDRVDLVVAVGDPDVVQAARTSGHPVLGLEPANVPVLVDASADPVEVARRLVASLAFDNSLSTTSESVLVVHEDAATSVIGALREQGAALLDADQGRRLGALMFPAGRHAERFVGQSASWVAGQAGVRVGSGTRVLVAPIEAAVPDEPLAHRKLAPVLGLLVVPSARHALAAARAVMRLGGAPHLAAVHSTDQQTVVDLAAAVNDGVVVVDAGASSADPGPGRQVQPSDFVQWVRVVRGDATGTLAGE